MTQATKSKTYLLVVEFQGQSRHKNTRRDTYNYKVVQSVSLNQTSRLRSGFNKIATAITGYTLFPPTINDITKTSGTYQVVCESNREDPIDNNSYTIIEFRRMFSCNCVFGNILA